MCVCALRPEVRRTEEDSIGSVRAMSCLKYNVAIATLTSNRDRLSNVTFHY